MERNDIIITTILVIAFVFLFFVKYMAITNPCTWKVCPDAGGGGGWKSLISTYPNFYAPAHEQMWIGGTRFVEAAWNWTALVLDILLFSLTALVAWTVRRRI